MPTDQYEFGDPRSRYPSITPPEQSQPWPGLQQPMRPVPDLGETSYRGTGRLDGRKALITGGDSGIGAAVAIAFAREGADVAISYLPEEQEDADRIISLIEKAGRKALALPGNLTDAAYCRSIVRDTVAAFGGLDLLVNNAGRQVAVEKLVDIADLDRIMAKVLVQLDPDERFGSQSS